MPAHEAAFRHLVQGDPDIAALLAAMRTFDAPDCWLVSGVLFQTVWNMLEGREQGHGVHDYDIFYFDPDTSYEAEDRWIRRAADHFAASSHRVELRNQARVHLWYRDKFGIAEYPQLKSSCDGVRQFLVQASVVAVRPRGDGTLELFAPLGLDDVFDRTLRPNPLWQGPPRPEYLAKVRRYMRDWPSLKEVSGIRP